MRIQAGTPKARIPAHSLSLEPSRQCLLTPEGEALRFPTDGSTFHLGSDEDCLIRWQGPEIEGKHAQARWRNGQLEVRGQNTLVNGDRCPDWKALGDGGHIQLGDINQPTFSLAVLSDQTYDPSDKPLAITYFGDASAPNISRQVAAQPGRLAKLLQESTSLVKVQGVVLRGGRLNHLAQAALPVTMGAIAAGGLGMGVLGLVQGMNVPMMVLGGITAVGGSLVAAANWKEVPGHWKAATAQPSLTEFPSAHVKVSSLPVGPSNKRFDEAWKTSLSNWPQARQIVYLSGHGYQHEAAGVNFAHLAQTVQGAEAILLDACNGGQIEALSQLAASARVAVASEHTVRGFGFPLDAMLGQPDFPADPKALATSLVMSASHGRPAKSLVAIDLQALQKDLLPSLGQLGRRLQRADLGTVKHALQNSETTDTAGKTTVDLGSFLAQLEALQLPEVAKTQAALNACVLAMIGHGTISFDKFPPSHMPTGWRDLMRDLRK